MIALYLVMTGATQIFFVSLPGWFIAAALYLILSKAMQKKTLNANLSPRHAA